MMDERQSNRDERERRIREAIRSAGAVGADAAFRERLKRGFIDGTISEHAVTPKEPRARALLRWGWILVPAAAALVLFALFLPRPAPTWAVQAMRGEGRIEIDGEILPMDDAALVAGALSSGGHVRLIDEGSLDLLLDDRLLLELDGGADVTMPAPPRRESADILLSEVHHGELRIKTGPGFPGMELHILTAEGRTEIVGTIVSVYRGDGFTCVCVLEGTARIGADETRLEDIPRGMRKVMFGDGRPPLVTEIEPQHEAGLLEFEERYRSFFPTQK